MPDAEAAIASLRAGRLPEGWVASLFVGHAALLVECTRVMARIRDGRERGAFKFLVGNPGAGKTTLLSMIEEAAQANKFATAKFDADPRSNVFTNDDEFAFEIFRKLRAPVASQSKDWRGVLEDFARLVIHGEKRNPEAKPGTTTRSRVLKDATRARVEKLGGADPTCARLVSEFVVAFDLKERGRGEEYEDWTPEHRMRAVLEWFRGQGPSTSAARDFEITTYIGQDNAFAILSVAVAIARAVGLSGLAVLIDEGAQVASQWSGSQVQRSWELTRRLVDGEIPGTFVFLGLTERVFRDQSRGTFSYLALLSRVGAAAAADAKERDPCGLVYYIGFLRPDELQKLFPKICELHREAFAWSGDGISGREELVTGELCGGGPMQARQFVQRATDRLDRARTPSK